MNNISPKLSKSDPDPNKKSPLLEENNIIKDVSKVMITNKWYLHHWTNDSTLEYDFLDVSKHLVLVLIIYPAHLWARTPPCHTRALHTSKTRFNVFFFIFWITFIFWCWLLYHMEMAENQKQSAK